MIQRPRRNRKNQAIRQMVCETLVTKENLIFPLFLIEGENKKMEISAMPGIFRYSADLLCAEIEDCLAMGLHTFAIFPAINEAHKDKYATESYNREGLYLRTLRKISEQIPEATLMTDIAMDPYSSDGHDGIVEQGEILNDPTLEVLGKMALAQAQTGASILGPSDMMDGRVGYLRQLLDKNGYTQVSIMAYTAKYASAFYNPFRHALNSAPKAGDKKTYQMDPANVREALREAALDTAEGADFLMVKPALAYLDVIKTIQENTHLPVAAYNVSGEYAMLKAAVQNNWLDNQKAITEVLLSIRRAGANVILTYFAKEFAQFSHSL